MARDKKRRPSDEPRFCVCCGTRLTVFDKKKCFVCAHASMRAQWEKKKGKNPEKNGDCEEKDYSNITMGILHEKMRPHFSKQSDLLILRDATVKAVSHVFGVSPSQALFPGRSAQKVHCRRMVMFMLKSDLGLSSVLIANLLHIGTHSTVLRGYKRARSYYHTEEEFRDVLRRIREEIARYLQNHQWQITAQKNDARF